MTLPQATPRTAAMALVVALFVSTTPISAASSAATCPMDAGRCDTAASVGSCCCLQAPAEPTSLPAVAFGELDAGRGAAVLSVNGNASAAGGDVAVLIEPTTPDHAPPQTASHAVLRI